MLPRPTPTARTFRQIALAALVLVALVVGSLAHNHTGRGVTSASSDSCVACLLHHTSATAPVVALPKRIPAPPVVQLVIAALPHRRLDLTLDVAPKTSPPSAAVRA